jgi:acetyl-CoA hydrolase
LGGASAGRRFFAGGADNVVPANISDVSSLVATGRLPIDIVLLQVSGPDERGQHYAGLGIEHPHAAIGRARLVIAQVNPELPWTNVTQRSSRRRSTCWCRPPRRRSSCQRGPQGAIDRANADHIPTYPRSRDC